MNDVPLRVALHDAMGPRQSLLVAQQQAFFSILDDGSFAVGIRCDHTISFAVVEDLAKYSDTLDNYNSIFFMVFIFRSALFVLENKFVYFPFMY